MNSHATHGLVLLLLAAPALAQAPMPPVARTDPHPMTIHGHTRTDPYYWLKERENPEVIAYLEAENAYTRAVMAPTQALQEQLFEEIKGRIQQTDTSVPYRENGYWYLTRFEEGKDYPVYVRKNGTLEAPDEVLLDANVLAEGHGYFAVGARAISLDNQWMAFNTDTRGRRLYTLQFKHLPTGALSPESIPGVTNNVVWANDHRTVFYTRQDPTTLRWHQVWRHTIGTDPAQDVLVFEETDETFSTFVTRSRSHQYLLIGSSQTLADEYRYLDAHNPTGTFQVFLPRQRGHEYSLDHAGGRFYIRTNDQAQNFRLMSTPQETPGREHWTEVVPHRAEVLLQDFVLFEDYLVLQERRAGLTHLHIRPWDGTAGHDLDFGEPAYLADLGINPDFDSRVLRYTYTSLTTPGATFDYDLATRQKTLLKQEAVLGGFDAQHYATERLTARASDGTLIPISLVYRKDLFRRDGTNPLLLYGYGSYGSSTEPTFSSPRLSLIDRGFVYAIAHIRGGQELGRSWYEDGKLLRKMNTFTDFIACGEHLVAQRYADPERLYASGGSAGGLLMGAVVNLRPDLFKGVIAAVPFVDVITTMLDETIPLTTSEYDEWGNPNDKVYYDYMLAYSPYDQVQRKAYPHLLVTTGLHDSQVQYWEPAKWVAKLRAMKTDDHRLLLKTNMEAGHGGASGRFERYRETAFQYAFLLDLAGVIPPGSP
jgi:oligopeptidase B